MDDDEEIQSHTSAASGSPSPSPPNGRITVTVAAVPPQQQNSNALALVPIHQTKSNGGGREDCWSEAATAVLIEAWGERYLELSRGNLKQKHWKEVADIVSSRDDYGKLAKTDVQCKNRIDTVKKKYKSEKAKIAAGGPPSKWPFYQRLDHLIGPTAKIPVTPASAAAASKVPVGIPVGIRGGSGSNSFQFHKSQSKINNQATKNQNPKSSSRKRNPVETESSSSDEDNDNYLESEEDDYTPINTIPPEKKPRVTPRGGANSTNPAKKDRKGWGNSIRMLTQAILKFGEAYEQAESAKLQQVVEMEKSRMKFTKELELQRMQFMMKTQMEISQLKRCRRGGNGGSNHHHTGNNVIIHKNSNSDSDN